jgi:hypothetical protein
MLPAEDFVREEGTWKNSGTQLPDASWSNHAKMALIASFLYSPTKRVAKPKHHKQQVNTGSSYKIKIIINPSWQK